MEPLYRGAIDDQYGINIVKDSAENHYLKNALDSILKNEDITYALTGAPGCMIDSENKEVENQEITYHKHIARIMQNNVSNAIGMVVLVPSNSCLTHR